MEKTEKEEVEEMVSAAARLALFLADAIEPVSSDVLEQDLDKLYEMCIAVERQARAKYPEWK